jgi:hypothetical protein
MNSSVSSVLDNRFSTNLETTTKYRLADWAQKALGNINPFSHTGMNPADHALMSQRPSGRTPLVQASQGGKPFSPAELPGWAQKGVAKAYWDEFTSPIKKFANGRTLSGLLGLFALGKLVSESGSAYESGVQAAKQQGKTGLEGLVNGLWEGSKHFAKNLSVWTAGSVGGAFIASLGLVPVGVGLFASLPAVALGLLGSTVFSSAAQLATTAVVGETGSTAVENKEKSAPEAFTKLAASA